MAASKKEVAKATSMAAAGKSAQQIQNKTGVSANRAANIIASARASNTPVLPGAPSMSSASTAATPYVAAPSAPSTPSTPAEPAKPKYNSPVQQAVATYSDWNKGGAGFGGKDIASLQEQGMSPNQIMKIAAAIGNLEGGRINNRANTILTAGFPTARKSGGGLTDAYFANTKDPFMQGLGRSQGKLPGKVLKWGGITAAGKPLAVSGTDFTKDPFGAGNPYTWTPRKGLSQEGLDKVSMPKTTIADTGLDKPTGDTLLGGGGDGSTLGGGGDGVDGTTLAGGDGTLTGGVDTLAMPSEYDKFGSFTGATGWRARQGSRSKAGSKARGLSSTRLSSPTGSWSYRI